MQPTFSLNPWTDVVTMWSYPYLRHALIAGSIVAIVASVLGWVMVLRRESFLGHTLAIVSFPGAAVALALGIPPQIGYYGATVVAALIAGRRRSSRVSTDAARDATTGTVQAVALSAGLIAVSATPSFLDTTTSLLFGSFLGITTSAVIVLAIVATVSLAVTVLIARPLVFASLDSTAAEAAGVPVRAISTLSVITLGLVVASASQITGALLVFAVLVMPATIARSLTGRIWLSCGLSVVISLVIVCVGLTTSFFLPLLPFGFSITTVAMVLFVSATVVTATPSGRRRVFA
jgi:zinc/manganese transport system permease protein